MSVHFFEGVGKELEVLYIRKGVVPVDHTYIFFYLNNIYDQRKKRYRKQKENKTTYGLTSQDGKSPFCWDKSLGDIHTFWYPVI